MLKMGEKAPKTCKNVDTGAQTVQKCKVPKMCKTREKKCQKSKKRQKEFQKHQKVKTQQNHKNANKACKQA